MSEEVKVTAVGDVTSLVSSFDKAASASSKMASSVEAAAGKAEAASEGMKSKVKDAVGAIGAAMGIGLGIDKIIEFGKKTIEATTEANTAMAQTQAVMKSTGGAAGVSSDGIDKLAGSLGRKTAVDHAQVQSGLNMLLTFRDIRNEAGKGNDVFNQTSSVMMDMARAMHQGPTQTALQLGKALNDPAKGLAMLGKEGVTFDASQQKTIKTMEKMGNTAGAQKIMLAELNKEFGGSGAAYAKSWAGSVDGFKNSLTELEVAIGSKVMPTLAKFARDGSKAMDWLTDKIPSLTASGGSISTVFAHIGDASKTILPTLVKVWEALSPLRIAFEALKPVLPILAKNLQSISAELSAGLGTALKVILPPLVQVIANVIQFATPLLKSKTAIEAIVLAFLAWKAVTGVIALVSGATAIYKGVQDGAALATYGFKAAQDASTLSQKAGAAVMLVMQGVQKGATMAQMALNAAWEANPIGVVIVLVVALVAALIWFFTQTKLGKEIVVVAMKAIGDIWNWLWKSVIQPVIGFVVALWKVLLANLKTGAAQWSAIFKAIGAYFHAWWTGTVEPVINWVKAAWSLMVRAFQMEGRIIGSTIHNVASFFVGLWNMLSGIFGKIGSAWGSLWSGAASVVGGAFSSVVSVVRGAINGVIGTINGAISAIDGIHVSIPKGVPLVGGMSFGVNIPTIPMLAKGGKVTNSGTALVGEAGPELLTLPVGAKVQPLTGSDKSALHGGGNTYNFDIHVPPKAERDDVDFAERMMSAIRFAVGGQGSVAMNGAA